MLAVAGSGVWVRGMLWCSGHLVVEYVAGLGDVIGHAEVYRAFVIVPVEMDAEENFAVPVYSAFVLLGEMVDEVVGVSFVDVFDSKVIDHETEIEVASFVFEQTWSTACMDVPPFWR